MKRVKEWFGNHARKSKTQSRFTFMRRWHWKQVVGYHKKAEIETTVQELSGASPGDPKYLGKYQKGLLKVCQELNGAEKVKFKKEAKDWNERAPPWDMQCRYVFEM